MDFNQNSIKSIFRIKSSAELKYVPIKVIQKSIAPTMKSLMTQRIVVFVGEVDSSIKSVLLKLEKNAQGAVSEPDARKLKDEFGANWKQLLHIGKMKGGAIDDEIIYTEEDSDSEMPDMELEDELDKELKTTSSESAKPEEKVSKSGIKYIFDYINLDDEIDTVKRKIEGYLEIEYAAQHNWYLSENKVHNLDYQCRVIVNENLTQPFSISINDIFGSSSQKNILGINVDQDFIRTYKLKSQMYIMNTTNNILADQYYSGFLNSRTIYTMDLYTVINLIGYGNIQTLRTNNFNQFEAFYYGFVLKYWPAIKVNDLIAIINHSHLPSPHKQELKVYIDKQYYINIMNTIENTEIEKMFTMQTGITGFDFSINKKFSNLFETDILKLNDIFNNINVSEDIPFITYYTHGIPKPKYKIHVKNESNYYIDYHVKKWTDGASTSTGITFKVRMVLDKKNPLYDSSFMTIYLNGRGKMDVKITWKEGYIDNSFDHINLESFYTVVNDIIIKINKSSPKSAFIKNIMIPEIYPDRKNVNFQFINFFSRLKFKRPEDTLNYKLLRILVNTFRSHVREVRPKKMRRSQTQNEAKIGYIRKSKFHKFPKSKQLNQFWIDAAKIKSTEPKSIYIHVSEAIQNEPKIAMHGVKNFAEFDLVYNFIIRLIYLSVNLEEFFKRPGTERLKEEYKRNTVREKDLKKEEYIETYYASKKREMAEGKKKSSINPSTGEINTKYKKIKLLKAYDSKLFGYKKTDKYESYSRLCQNEKQPYPMSNEELAIYKRKHPNSLAVKYTSDEEPINYVCEHSLYKYPGFISPDKHPENKCLPCCFINDSISNPKSKNSKTYKMCLGKEEPAGADEKPDSISQKYIKQYTKFITDNRLSNPPQQLNRFLNETKIGLNGQIEFKGERRSRRSIYETDKKHPPTYLLLGIPQHHRSFITAVEAVLDIPRGKMLNELIDKLKKKHTLFDTLSGGTLKRRFGKIENFITYLQNPNIPLNPADVEDLIVRLNDKFPDQLQINIMYEQDDVTMVKCIERFNIIDQQNLKHIVIFNTGNYYYPIVLIGETDDGSIQRVYSANHKIVVLLTDLLAKMCIGTGIIVEKMKYVNLNMTLPDLYNLLKKIGYTDKIKHQLVNHKNFVMGLIIDDNGKQFTIPVLMSDPIKGIPLTTNYYYGNWNVVYQFLQKISKELFATGKYTSHPDNNTIISKLIVDPSNKYVIGLVLRYKLEMYIEKTPVSKIKLDPLIKKLRYKVQLFDPDVVNKSIKNNDIIKDKRIDNVSDIKYQQEIYNLVKFEVNNILFKERNQEIRKLIIKLFEKYPNQTIIDHLSETNIEFDQIDVERLTELMRIVKYFSKKGPKKSHLNHFTDYFDRYTFFFDLITIGKIEKILENTADRENIEPQIRKIIEGLLKNTLTIGKKLTNKKINKPCSEETKQPGCNNGYCIWDTSGKCKIIIESATEYQNILTRIVNELIKNISARNEFLKVKMSWLLP